LQRREQQMRQDAVERTAFRSRPVAAAAHLARQDAGVDARWFDRRHSADQRQPAAVAEWKREPSELPASVWALESRVPSSLRQARSHRELPSRARRAEQQLPSQLPSLLRLYQRFPIRVAAAPQESPARPQSRRVVQECRQRDDVDALDPPRAQLRLPAAAPRQLAQLRSAGDVMSQQEARLRARVFRAPTSLEFGRPDRP